jgi:N-acyl-D-aspartate/D-glutamate deacylase
VHLVTGEPAFAFGLTGRGVLAPGAVADVTIFDADTVGPEPLRMVSDLPAGASRLYNGARGMAHVVVSGVEVVRDGALTGDQGGRVLRAGRDTHTVTCADYWRGIGGA